MDIRERTTSFLNKRLRKLEENIPSCLPLLKGSVSIIGRTNKQPRFTTKKKGKTQSTYLGKDKEKKAKQYVDNYHNLIEIVNEISDINLELIRRNELPRGS